MNLFKLFAIVVFICTFSTSIKAQQVKPVFKKLMYAVYRPTLADNKKTVRIQDYFEIDENGILHSVKYIYEDDYGNHLSFKGRMRDTTYKTPDSLIIELNKVFNGSKKLINHITSYKLPKDQIFAGPYEFITYTDKNNETDNLVIVLTEFLDSELSNLLNKFWYLHSARIKHNDNTYRNQSIEEEVSKYHYACKYLIPIQEPPRVMLPGRQ